jgi:hypothetical protein
MRATLVRVKYHCRRRSRRLVCLQRHALHRLVLADLKDAFRDLHLRLGSPTLDQTGSAAGSASGVTP